MYAAIGPYGVIWPAERALMALHIKLRLGYGRGHECHEITRRRVLGHATLPLSNTVLPALCPKLRHSPAAGLSGLLLLKCLKIYRSHRMPRRIPKSPESRWLRGEIRGRPPGAHASAVEKYGSCRIDPSSARSLYSRPTRGIAPTGDGKEVH